MLRRIPRYLRVSVVVAVLLAVSVSVFQSWTSTMPGTAGWVQTQWGPLGPADRDLLVKVRLAGLWEGPTGQQAMQQAISADVQEVGRVVSSEHATLDAKVREVADQLGVLLPTSPSTQQLGWMSEISAQTGSDYDRMFVQRLREAHGTVLPVIAEVRVATRNSLIRSFAAEADTFVSGHLGHLEGSGLVDYSALPEAPSGGLFSAAPGPGDFLVPIAVFAAALLAALGMVMRLRQRGFARPRRAVPQSPADAATFPAPAAFLAPRRPLDDHPDLMTPRRVPTRTAPGETTGPRHAVRR